MKRWGSLVLLLSALYGFWLALVFLVAIPPPGYTIPRLLLVILGLIVGWRMRHSEL